MLKKYELLLNHRLQALKNIFQDSHMIEQFEEFVTIIKDTIKNKKEIFVFGNGGSAADAMHFSGELVGRFKKNRCPYPVHVLNCDVASMTAIANDFSYDDIFARQVEAFAKKGDLLFVLTTSGNSVNVLKALEYANDHDIVTSGFIGKDGGRVLPLLKYPVHIRAEDTDIIQEVQKTLIHIMCAEIDDESDNLV